MCRPSGAGPIFDLLPRADALGYPLDAPPALAYLVHGDMDRLNFDVEFMERQLSTQLNRLRSKNNQPPGILGDLTVQGLSADG